MNKSTIDYFQNYVNSGYKILFRENDFPNNHTLVRRIGECKILDVGDLKILEVFVDKEVFDWALVNYANTVCIQNNKTYTPKYIAKRINTVFSLDNPKNKVAYNMFKNLDDRFRFHIKKDWSVEPLLIFKKEGEKE